MANGDGFLFATKYTYDASGRLLSARDAAGSVTKNSYDALGRAVVTVYPDDSRITAVYDARGRVISAVSADGTTDILTRWRALWDEKTKKVF